MTEGAVTFHDGRTCPQIALGMSKQPVDVMQTVIDAALGAGYRHFDSASIYGNEAELGAALKNSGVPREELFITTKLWADAHAYDAALRRFDAQAKSLQVDYVDLYLIHWPAPEQDLFPEAWRALVQLQRDGRVRSIGVSNFSPMQIERIIEDTEAVPVVNQVKLNPGHQQRDIRSYHEGHNILLEAYSPLGRGEWLDNPLLAGLAEKYGRSVAQIIIRWQVQEGIVTLPKSQTPARIAANIDVFDFALNDDEMTAIRSLDGRS